MCPAAKYALLPAGHAGPALQGARSHGADRVVRPYTFCAGRRGRRPLRTLSLRASPQTGAAIRFPTEERTDSHASDTVTGSE